MSRIDRILRIRNCGIFRELEWPKDLTDFGRFNLIYGWNGTGKTTLSRILRYLEKKAVPPGDVAIVLDGKKVEGHEFPHTSLPVRVFNRDFVFESVFPVGGGDLPPIFVFGAESVEKQKALERLRRERAHAQSILHSQRLAKQEAEKQLDQFCINQAKLVKETLRSSGQNKYNNYDKADFRKDAEEIAKCGDGSAYPLSEEERDKLLKQHYATPKPKVVEIAYCFPSLEELAGKVTQLLETTIVSAAIQSLRDDAALAEWTREGVRLHKERKSDKCLFCDQLLPADRLAKLEAHFNAEYEQFLEELEKNLRDLELIMKTASNLKLPNRAELYEHLTTEYDAAERALRQVLDTVQEFIGVLMGDLKNKQTQPFKRLSLSKLVPSIDDTIVDRINTIIRKHNKACDDFPREVAHARDRLAQGMIAEELEAFRRLEQEVLNAEGALREAERKVKELDTEIARLERDVVEHRRPAEELNEDLRTYLGHNELLVEVKDTGYQIIRNGEPAKTLSEGEMTAIALLYFLKSLKDKDFALENGIVVLDDPVSSLDANALYLAFGFIRERAKDSGQLFIFTHNFAFFRQVRNWFYHLKGQKKHNPTHRPARFYMLECVSESNGRCASIRWLDPLLEQYDTEYHYLFKRIYQVAQEGSPAKLEENYAVPNMARRLLEGFLSFRQPHVSGELWQKVQSLQFDEAKKVRILRFLHTYSHSSGLAEPEHDPSLLGESQAVLKDLLELIQSQDGEHYKAMVQLVSSPTDSEPDVDEGSTA